MNGERPSCIPWWAVVILALILGFSLPVIVSVLLGYGVPEIFLWVVS